MGSEQCKECKQEKSENYAYGQHEVIKELSNVYVMVEKKVQKNPKIEASVKKQLELRKNISSQNIVKLHNYRLDSQDYGFKVTMYYEYVPITLRDRIQEHHQKGSYFTQRELFSLVYGVQNALNELAKLQIKHGCINLDTIVCRNNFYKITDVSSTTYITSYDLAKQENRQQFLTEHLLDSLAHKSLDPIYQLKDDFFSLGMLVLMIVSGAEVQDFYRWNDKKNHIGKLYWQQVEKSFRDLESLYSSKLVRKVRSLIDYNQGEKQQKTNVSDSLQEIDEQFRRICHKYPNSSIIQSHSSIQFSHFSFS